MTHLNYIIAGWLITFLGIGLYISYVIAAAKRLSPQVPAEYRRWMESPNIDLLDSSNQGGLGTAETSSTNTNSEHK